MLKSIVANAISKTIKGSLNCISPKLSRQLALEILNDNKELYVLNKAKQANDSSLAEASLVYDESLVNISMEFADNPERRLRQICMYSLLGQVIKRIPKNISIAECGCWRGQSSYMICEQLSRNKFDGEFLIFDSFEGLSDFTEKDKDIQDPMSTAKEEKLKKHFSSSVELVKNNLAKYSFVKLFKGWIPERFNEVSDRTFGFVNIDVDLYQPILDSIKFFYPRLIKGGALFFDDYGSKFYPGAKRAVDEYVANEKPEMFMEIPFGGAFIIK